MVSECNGLFCGLFVCAHRLKSTGIFWFVIGCVELKRASSFDMSVFTLTLDAHVH